MSSASHLRELDLLRRQVADLARELMERDQVLREQHRQLDDELVDLREQSEMLRAIVTSTAAETGEGFFSTLASHLSSALGVQYAIVGEVLHSPLKKIRTVVVSAGGVLIDNFEYSLANTPCETTLGQTFTCFERDVRDSFPACERLAQLSVEGYCGVPLRATGGAVIGLLVVMDTKPLQNTERLRSLMAVFASRAGAELQRRQAEIKLNQQQRHLIEAQALAHLGSWDWDIDSGNVLWSEELFRIFGHEPGAIPVTYDTFLNALHPDDHDRVLRAINEALTGRTMYDVECRIVRPNHEIRTIHCRGEVVRGDNGRPVSMSGSALDITDRQRVDEGINPNVTQRTQAPEAWRESQSLFQQFAESVGSAFLIEDLRPDGTTIVYVNSAFTRIWGVSQEEFHQNSSLWLDSIHPEDRERVEAAHARFLAGSRAEFDCEYRIVRREGHIRWISDRRVRMAGWEHRIAGIAEDITHDRQRLALMAQTEAIGKIGVWELDLLTNYLWWSDETYRLHDTTPERYSPTVETALTFYTPESRPIIAEALRKGVTQGKGWDLELDIISAKGRSIAVRAAGKIEVLDGRAVRAYGTLQDITERKRADEALRRAHDELERKVIERTAELRASEERYARATAIGKVGVWELDVLSGQYYGDANLKSLFGYAPDELSTDPFVWLRLVHPEDQPIAMENWELLQSGAADSCHYELRMVRKDGSIVWTDVRCHSARGEDGRLTHLIGATVDVTERKLAEQALRESEERFAKAFRTSPHPIGITEVATGRCIEVNDACLELFGFRREEVIGNTTLMLGIWPNLEDRVRVIERLKAGQPVRNMEFALRIKSGALRHLLASADLAELNGTLCIITVANDITDRKQAEEALRVSEERFAKAFQASPHPVVISELDSGRVVDVNDAACQLLGYRKEEVVGHTTLQIGLWHSVDERGKYLELLKRQGSVRNVEVALRSKDGEVRQCLLSSELIELNGKQCSVTVGDDVTESRRLEKALRLTQFSVDQAVEAIMWLDPNARMFSVNDAACRMLEYSREQLLAMTVHDIDPNFPVERWMNHWNYLKQQGALTFEAKFWSRTGTVLETDVTVNYLQHEGKEYACMILRDIGERKRAEAELRRSHLFLRQVIDTAPNLIFAKDRAGRFAMANKAVADWYGTTVEDLIGKSEADFNSNADEVEFFRQNDLEVLNSMQESFIPEEKITDAAGRTRWLQTVKRPIFDDYGHVHMVLGAATDITERKRMEEAVRESEERYRTLVELSPSGVFVFGEGRTVYINHRGAMILGAKDPREILDRPTFDFIHPDYHQQVRENVKRLLTGGMSVHSAERIYLKLDGTPVPVQIEAAGITWNGKPAILGLFSDITERKQAEQAVWKSRQAIRALHNISSAQGQSFNERVEALLQLGCRFFDLPIGIETVVRDEEWEVVRVNAPGLAFHPGMRAPLYKTYCSETLCQHGTLSFEHAGASPEWQRHPAYSAMRLESYIGAAINGLERTYGTLCFASLKPREKCFTDSERDFIELMARWLGGELDRQSALDGLRQSEERYRTLYDETPSMYFTVDGTGIIRSVNHYGAQYLGYRVEDMVGKAVAAIFFEEDRARVCAEMEAFFRHPEGVGQWEFRKVRSDGAVLWVRELARVLQAQGGESFALIVCEDITERKQAEEALRENHERLELALEASHTGTWRVDLKTGLDMRDASLNRLLALPATVTTQPVEEWFSYVHPDDLPLARQAWECSLTTGLYDVVHRLIPRDGDIRWVHDRGIISCNAAGQPLHAIGAVHDITERKRAEEMLQAAKDQLQAVLDNSTAVIFIKNLHGQYLLINRRYEELHHVSQAEIVGKTDYHIHPRDVADVLHANDRLVLEAKKSFQFEETVPQDDGLHTFVSMKFPLNDASGKPYAVCCIATDITERKQMEEALRQREGDLRAALEERERISQDLHDGILQSLYAVGLGLEACKPLVLQEQKRVAMKLMTGLNQAIGQLNHVMGDVRNFIAGLESHVIQGGDFPTALRNMVRAMSSSSAAKCTIKIDHTAARQLSTEQALHIINIVREGLSNALRHSGAKRITVSLRSLIRSVRLAITDDGVGFNAGSAQGVGHGLANMAARAQKVRGVFAIQSKPNEGTTVSLELPKDTTYAHN